MKVLTTCTFCGCGCNYYLDVENGQVVGVSPSREHAISRGALCVKGWHSFEFVHSPDRLHHPLIKKNGSFRKASWEEALDLVTHRLGEIKARYGPEKIAFFSSAKTTNEENFLMMKLARAVFATNNVDHCARLCHSSTVLGLAATFGSGAMTNSIAEFEDAEVILATGTNTTEQHPQIAARIIQAAKKGARLIVVDPRRIGLSKYAFLHLRQRAGTDVAWLNGMMHIIIREGLEDREFIRTRTEGFEELKKLVAKYTPERVQEITGIPVQDLEAAAIAYARSRKSMLVYSMGITQHTTGVDNVKSCANLAMLTGNVGRPSTGVNPLRGQNNVQGACDMGALPDVYSGYQKVALLEMRQKFAAAWGVDELPEETGLTVVEAINATYDGRIKALYIMGENPMVSDPDINHVRQALEKIDFLVVQDIFLSETAELADVVLPGASFAEKDGTFSNTERRIQRIRKAIEPVGESLPDWQILSQMAERMGYKRMSYDSPAEIMEEIAALTPIYGGIHYDRLEGEGLQWPCPDRSHPGTPYLHKDKFAKGLGTFMPREYRAPAEEPDEEYSFLMTTGRVYFHWHTGSMTRRTSLLSRESPEAFVEISPEDAEAAQIRPGDLVRVASRRGEIKLKPRITTDVPPGTVFIPFHFYEAAANLLTNPALDPEAKIPEFKVCAVKVEKTR